MIKIDWNSSDSREIKGKNVRGFTFMAVISHLTANTAFAANPLDWSKLTGKATLTRNGKNYVIFNDVLAPLILDSAFLDSGFQNALQIGTFAGSQFVYVAAAASIKEILYLPGSIILPEIINLSSGDLLTVDVNVPNGALAATADPALSSFYYDVVEGVGMGRSIPYIECKSVRVGSSSDKASFGDNTLTVSFINIDKAGITSANQVLTLLQIGSDKFNINDDYQEIIGKRSKMFVNATDSNNRHQSFRLFDSAQMNYSGMKVRFNEVNIDATLNGGNVNSTKNWWVGRCLWNDDKTDARARTKIAQQIQENATAAEA